MRKIIRYASISWKSSDWQKLITWVDRDLEPWEWRGTRTRTTYKDVQVIEDIHTMFALQAKQPESEITITPMEREADVQPLKIQKERFVYVGNGFLYWETDDEVKK
jgi:hypothetical protein